MTTVAELPAGFADKVLSAQSTFRSVMDAMARPGSVQRISAVAGTPAAMMRGTAAIALTLFDHDTPVWLDPAMSRDVGCRQMAQIPHQRAGRCGFVGLQFCAHRRCAKSSRARSLRLRQRRISGSFDDADPAGREPDARAPPSNCRVRASTARPSLQRHDPAQRSVRAACRSTPRCFRAVSMSCWCTTMPLSRSRARRGSPQGEADHVCCRQGRRTRHRERPPPAGA